jgi:hypothetical protein
MSIAAASEARARVLGVTVVGATLDGRCGAVFFIIIPHSAALGAAFFGCDLGLRCLLASRYCESKSFSRTNANRTTVLKGAGATQCVTPAKVRRGP